MTFTRLWDTSRSGLSGKLGGFQGRRPNAVGRIQNLPSGILQHLALVHLGTGEATNLRRVGSGAGPGCPGWSQLGPGPRPGQTPSPSAPGSLWPGPEASVAVRVSLSCSRVRCLRVTISDSKLTCEVNETFYKACISSSGPSLFFRSPSSFFLFSSSFLTSAHRFVHPAKVSFWCPDFEESAQLLINSTLDHRPWQQDLHSALQRKC